MCEDGRLPEWGYSLPIHFFCFFFQEAHFGVLVDGEEEYLEASFIATGRGWGDPEVSFIVTGRGATDLEVSFIAPTRNMSFMERR